MPLEGANPLLGSASPIMSPTRFFLLCGGLCVAAASTWKPGHYDVMIGCLGNDNAEWTKINCTDARWSEHPVVFHLHRNETNWDWGVFAVDAATYDFGELRIAESETLLHITATDSKAHSVDVAVDRAKLAASEGVNATSSCETAVGTFSGNWTAGQGKACNQFPMPLYNTWPSPVQGDFIRIQPNEHPRLIFRKSQLAQMRQLYASGDSEARGIAGRLKQVLLESTNFTNWHAAGFCFLYQLEQNASWATMAKQYMTKGLAGAWPDLDGTTYNWKWMESCWNKQRLGPMVTSGALAYDMCYGADAWDDEFKATVKSAALAPAYPCGQSFYNTHNMHKIETCQPCNDTLPEYDSLLFNLYNTYPLSEKGETSVLSNHYGMIQDTLVTALAFWDDDGTNMTTLRYVYPHYLTRIRMHIALAFGNRGWFAEGDGEDRMCINTGMAEISSALRHTFGLELMDDSPLAEHLRWATMKWPFLTVGGKTWIPPDEHTMQGHWAFRPGNYVGQRGKYSYSGFLAPDSIKGKKYALNGGRNGLTYGGDFAMGMTTLSPRKTDRAVLRYTLNSSLSPIGDWARNELNFTNDTDYDIIRIASRGAYAYANWPFGAPTDIDPATVLGHAIADTPMGFVAFRNRWNDYTDTVISWLPKAGLGPHGSREGLAFEVQSLGLKITDHTGCIEHVSCNLGGTYIFNNSQLTPKALNRCDNDGIGFRNWSPSSDGTTSTVMHCLSGLDPAKELALAVDMSHTAGDNVELIVAICNASSTVPKPHATPHSTTWNVTKGIMFEGKPSNAMIIGSNGLIIGNRDFFVLVSCSNEPCPVPAVAGLASDGVEGSDPVITVGKRVIEFDESSRLITFGEALAAGADGQSIKITTADANPPPSVAALAK